MAKIKYTKNELKTQRDSLARFQRYLPTLLLKKQQLQMEVRRIEALITEKEGEERRERAGLDGWVALFSEAVDGSTEVKVAEIRHAKGNIAGVEIPVLEGVEFAEQTADLFLTPPWVDEGRRTMRRLVELRIQRQVFEEQRRLLVDELRVTTQRVNLFEKVKIPECRDNIRVIGIFLGDQMTAAVARSKIAKRKSMEKVRSS